MKQFRWAFHRHVVEYTMSSTELRFPLMTEQIQNQLLSYCEHGCNYFILIINVIQWGLHSELSKRDRFQVLRGVVSELEDIHSSCALVK